EPDSMTPMFDEWHELSPTHRGRGLRRDETTLRRIKGAVPDVAEVNLAQNRVSFPHSSKNSYCCEPQHDSSDDAPPLHNREHEHCRQDGKHQHEFTVAAE